MKRLLAVAMLTAMFGALLGPAQMVNAAHGAICDGLIDAVAVGEETYTLNGVTYEIADEGGSGNQAIIGTPGNDNLNGGSGHDLLCGLGGSDELEGGSGNDFLSGAADDDSCDGGSGNNTFDTCEDIDD